LKEARGVKKFKGTENRNVETSRVVSDTMRAEVFENLKFSLGMKVWHSATAIID
jgi:hypothetical protein